MTLVEQLRALSAEASSQRMPKVSAELAAAEQLLVAATARGRGDVAGELEVLREAIGREASRAPRGSQLALRPLVTGLMTPRVALYRRALEAIEIELVAMRVEDDAQLDALRAARRTVLAVADHWRAVAPAGAPLVMVIEREIDGVWTAEGMSDRALTCIVLEDAAHDAEAVRLSLLAAMPAACPAPLPSASSAAPAPWDTPAGPRPAFPIEPLPPRDRRPEAPPAASAHQPALPIFREAKKTS